MIIPIVIDIRIYKKIDMVLSLSFDILNVKFVPSTNENDNSKCIEQN